MGPVFRFLLLILAAGVPAASAAAQSPSTLLNECGGMSLGTNGALNGFLPAPNDAWHQDVSAAAIDPNSNKIITTSGDLAGNNLHPDFGSIAGGDYGIPYVVVDSSQTQSVPVGIELYVNDSDITVAPIPANPPIEGSPGSCPTDSNDRHLIVIDRHACVAYEYWQAASCNGGWTASNTALWDFTTTEQRPYGLTSADAAGLSVFEGLIRYDEIVAGSINHAIRFTANHTKNDANGGYFTAPATHAAGSLWGTDNIIGMRIRLMASFDVSGYSQTNQIILNAMKKYGMILADNGSNLFFQGTPDARWDDNDLDALKNVPASAFDVVQMAPVYDAVSAPTGAAPVISSFAAAASPVTAGTAVALNATVSGASYSYIDKAGFVRAWPVVVTPSATTTYTLTSRNAFGTASAAVTVTVQAGATPTPTLAFVAIPAQTLGTAPFAVSATTNSDGAITYSVVSGPATMAGNVVTLTGAGTVMLQASQAAAGGYTAATAQASFAVSAPLAVASFALATAGPGSVTVTPGGTATFALALTSANDAAAVTLACSGAPAGGSCTVTPATATLGPTVNVSAVVTTAAVAAVSPLRLRGLLWFAMLGPLGWLGRRRRRGIPLLAALLCVMAGLSGCGSGIVTAAAAAQSASPQTYTLTVSATSAGVTHNVLVTLVVQ